VQAETTGTDVNRRGVHWRLITSRVEILHKHARQSSHLIQGPWLRRRVRLTCARGFGQGVDTQQQMVYAYESGTLVFLTRATGAFST